MASPIVQFVDSPSTSAALRYDFNVKTPTLWCFPLTANAIDFGVPSFTGEPEGVGGFYGYRSLRFTQRIIGTRAVALARMSLLAREMFRAQNWLRFQWDPSASPVFFKTYQAEPGDLSLENAGQADAWDISVPLVADGLAYGPRQTVSTATITQAPSGTNPMRVVLPTIKGDAPTPLRVKITALGGATVNAANANSSWLVGCLAGTAGITDPVIDVGTGDTVTNISGTAAATTDATYFGGSYRVVTVPAATPNLGERFWMTVPNTLAPGRYKVLVRCSYTTAANATLLFQLEQWPNGAAIAVGQSTAVDVITNVGPLRQFWVDLGDFTFPFGVQPVSDISIPMPTSSIALNVGTADGSSKAVNVDAFKLIPIDGPTITRATLLRATGVGTSAAPVVSASITGTLDGDTETYLGLRVSLNNYSEAAPTLEGYFPVADPAAAQNVLIVMAMDNGSFSVSGGNSHITALNAQVSVDVSYYPRYLHIGDGA